MNARPRLRVAVASACCVLLESLSAGAADKGNEAVKLACIDDHEQAQILERRGKLLSARDSYVDCARQACPNLVRDACTKSLATLGDEVPSVLIRIRHANGEPINDAQLRVDGRSSERVSEPLELDPGEHVFTATLPDGRSVDKRVSLAPSEQSVPVVLSFENETPPAPVPEPRERSRAPEVVLGGLAVVGLSAFVGFGLAGKSTEACKPNCSDSERDTLRRHYLLADIGLMTFVAAGGAAVYLHVSRDASSGGADSGRTLLRVGGRF